MGVTVYNIVLYIKVFFTNLIHTRYVRLIFYFSRKDSIENTTDYLKFKSL